MKKNIESKIRLNVILLYLFIALVCGGFIFFFYSLSEQLLVQKSTYEEYYTELSIVNELTENINRSQIEANLYVYTRKAQHLLNFKAQMEHIEQTIDSLRNIYNLPADSIWDEINGLLKVKENSIMELNQQLIAQDEIIVLKERAFNRSIKEIENRNLHDTIVQGGEKRRFWRRVGDVFNPDEKKDTVIIVRQEQTNSIQEKEIEDPDDLLYELKRNQANYNRRIKAIEDQVKRLVVADQEISSKISDLLIQLNTQIIHSRWEELEREEAQLQKSGKEISRLGIAALAVMFIFIVFIIVDVNKGQKLRKALEEANEKNIEIMESRHKLLLSVSHDVKTPLNSILGYLEIYRQKSNLTDKEIVSMQNSGKHILALLNNLLEYSSLEQGKLELSPDNFAPNDLCDELTEMFAPLAKAKNLKFSCEKKFDPTLILYSDQLRLKQILINVLSNAIKYTQEGSIVFKAAYKRHTIAFTIDDTGAGIPKEKLNSIYKPFTRVIENISLAEGNGFGMYVVKGLIELFHGKIRYQSKEGKGTSVTITLPAEEGRATLEDHSTKNILLIDDDDVFVSMITRMCIQLGHRVTFCKTCVEFEELLKISTFDLVLTDMEIDTCTGRDILSKVKSISPETPVFLMTGRMDYIQQLAQSEGFSGYTSKPVTLKRLYMLIGGNFVENAKNENEEESMLGNTIDESVIEVIEEFLFSTVSNIVELRSAVEQDDFKKAQSICHKMRPMFVQLNADEKLTSTMKEMDSLRDKPEESKSYHWKEKMILLTEDIEEFLGQIQEKYFPVAN